MPANYLLESGLIVQRDDSVGPRALIMANVELGVPDNIKQMIERHVEHLDPDIAKNFGSGECRWS